MTNSWNKIKAFITRFKDLASLGFANIITNVISGFFWLYVAALLGTEHYGEVSYLLAVCGISGVISFLGAGNTVTVYAAKGVKILPPVYFITIASGLITSVVLFFFFYNIGVSLYVVGYVLFGLAGSEVLGRKMYKSYSKYIIIQKLLLVVLAIALYYIMGPHGVILGFALSFLPFSVRAYKTFKGTRIDFSVLRSHKGFIANSYILDLSRAFSSFTDKLIVGPMFGFVLLGNYSLGIQFFSLLTIIPVIVYQFVLPQDASGRPHMKLKKVTVLISVVLTIVGVLIPPLVLPVLFPKFTHAIEVIQIISLATIPATINLMYISKFLGVENSKIVLKGSGIYLAVQILSILVLGKLFSINGVAAALVLANSAETIFLVSMIRKK